MTDIIPFSFETNEVRVIDQDGQPWFALTDVCRVLEHSNPAMAAKRLDEDERGVANVYTPGGDQDMLIINESGLYSLILTSRKAAAKRFKKWVTAEVLPTIRKTGGYELLKATEDTATIAALRERLALLEELVELQRRDAGRRRVDAHTAVAVRLMQKTGLDDGVIAEILEPAIGLMPE